MGRRLDRLRGLDDWALGTSERLDVGDVKAGLRRSLVTSGVASEATWRLPVVVAASFAILLTAHLFHSLAVQGVGICVAFAIGLVGAFWEQRARNRRRPGWKGSSTH